MGAISPEMDYWCPLDDELQERTQLLAPDVRTALSRFARGECIPDAHKDRLCALGFAHIQGGGYVLTSLGATISNSGACA